MALSQRSSFLSKYEGLEQSRRHQVLTAGTLKQGIVDRPGAWSYGTLSILCPERELRQGRPPSVLTIFFLVLVCQYWLAGTPMTGERLQKAGKGIWDVGRGLILSDDLGWLTQLVVSPLFSACPKSGPSPEVKHLLVEKNVLGSITRLLISRLMRHLCLSQAGLHFKTK